MYRELDRNAPVFLQIFNKIKKDILIAQYPPNTQIPTVRQLACDMAVNPNTVQKALQLLEDEGLIVTRGTLGKFVTSDTEKIASVKKAVQNETLRAWLSELNALGITNDDVIEFIKKEVNGV